MPALWTLFEWSKLFILSGYTWNPVGLAFGGSLYTLQLASITGIFGLSFLVMFTNMLALRAFAYRGKFVWLTVVVAPYIIGGAIFHYHSHKINEHPKDNLQVVLVQTAFPIEESMFFESQDQLVAFITEEWKQILKITAKQKGKKVDLIALPEFVVPFGTYTFVYSYDKVKAEILAAYGPDVPLPPKELPFADFRNGHWMVNNAFWAQSMANHFEAPLVTGLEDVDELPNGKRAYYSAAIYFEPNQIPFTPRRYSKRVLVPMGEYIPFSFVQDLAARYGICGSFTCGEEAVAWPCSDSKFGVSICYEETFGHLMRENRMKGAEFLINITNDAWYPHSRLMRQHLEHSRLRTVENGFPLLRACNTGITCAIDSLGRDVAVLAADAKDPESVSDSLYAEVSSYHYFTLYSILGDWLIIGFSLVIVLGQILLGINSK